VPDIQSYIAASRLCDGEGDTTEDAISHLTMTGLARLRYVLS
jgi:hypothetical protein